MRISRLVYPSHMKKLGRDQHVERYYKVKDIEEESEEYRRNSGNFQDDMPGRHFRGKEWDGCNVSEWCGTVDAKKRTREKRATSQSRCCLYQVFDKRNHMIVAKHVALGYLDFAISRAALISGDNVRRGSQSLKKEC